jgi:hypothetical protein
MVQIYHTCLFYYMASVGRVAEKEIGDRET